MQLNQTNEDLAQRPLKTDIISAIAQQEVRACDAQPEPRPRTRGCRRACNGLALSLPGPS